MLRVRFWTAVLLWALGLWGGASSLSQAGTLPWYDSTYKAQMSAPQQALIDEIDSLAPARGGGLGEPQARRPSCPAPARA